MKKLTSPIAGFAAAAALACTFVAIAPTAQAQNAAPFQRMSRERHPEIRRAINQLERVETTLRRSASDFDGHKEKAADHVQRALEELKLALASDRH